MSRDLFNAHLEKVLRQYESDFDGVIGIAFRDLVSNHSISINGDRVFPIGSVIKIAILLEFFRQVTAGKLSGETRTWIEKEHKVPGSGVLQYLGDHTTNCTLRDLAVLMINLSDNTATNMLIDLVGIENVNRTLQALGLRNTRLARKMMDITAAMGGNENVSTPNEIASLLIRLYSHDGITKDVSEECLKILKMPKSEDYLSSGLPPDTILANKPGQLPGIVSDCGIVYLSDRPYILCLMITYLGNELAGERIIRHISRTVFSHVSRVAKSSELGRRFSV